MIKKIDKNSVRKAKQKRIRATLSGTSARPRLNVYRSLTNIYAQVIDDENGVTLCSSSTMEKGIKAKLAGKTKSEQAYMIGEDIAKKAIKKGIKEVVFDRAGYIFTGRVAKVAEGARNAGLNF
ncbi:MAG: 50S ribosomal protein L18 [Christensenellales bacterium]